MLGACTFTSEQTKYVECVNPATTVTPSGAITVLWDQLMGGRPRATVNPAQLRGMSWTLVWIPGLGSYAVDLTLDDVAFVTAGDAGVDASIDAVDGGRPDRTPSGEAAPE